jgi:hypothetical protein
MKKLSLDALKEKAKSVVTSELMGTISGGLLDACHAKVTAGPISSGTVLQD